MFLIDTISLGIFRYQGKLLWGIIHFLDMKEIRQVNGTDFSIERISFQVFILVIHRPFSYASLTKAKNGGGKFSGCMKFVPGSLSEPLGPEFDVHLEPFNLSIPFFLY